MGTQIKKILKTIGKSRKKLLISGIILIGLFFSLSQVFGKKSNKPQYQTAKVTRQSIISTVSESGNVSGNATSITSPTNGVIEEIYVKNGDGVTAGQDLFKVKSTATPQEQASSYASYQSAVNSLTSAKDNQLSLDASMWSSQQSVLDAQNEVDYKNANSTNQATKRDYTDLEKQSIESKLVQAHKDFAATERKYKDAGTAVTAAQAQVNATFLTYKATQDSIVIAPIDGTVANLSVNAGAVVSASNNGNNSNSSSGSSSTPSSSGATTASTVLVIGDFSKMQIKIPASEIDIPKIKPDQKATITLDAFPDKTFVGTVTNTDMVGTSSSGVVTYNVFVDFVAPPSDIQPGMTASVIIQTDRKDNVLTVPSSAIQTTNGDSSIRIMKKEGQVISILVEVGISSDTDSEIISGLSEGDIVVTSVVTTTRTGTGQTTSPFSAVGGRGFGGGATGRGGGTTGR